MTSFKKIALMSLIGISLVACSQQPLTYDYLLTHPKKLQAAFTHCDAAGSYENDCETVRKAANDFSLVVRDRSDNPEKFGEQILNLQQELVKMSATLTDLQTKMQSAPQDKDLQTQISKMKAEYAVKKQKTDVMLAVVAATSFE